jgi:cyclic 2,3-diphosphoglycerate synthase
VTSLTFLTQREPPAEPGSAGREREVVRGVRAVALIDGEHYPPVVRDALQALPYEWEGAILVGGTEKLRDGSGDYGVPLVDGFGSAEVVVDLSDEPVLGPVERFEWASRALAAGLPFIGADFRFDPPELEQFELPSISVIGTGKRVGKTAVTAHLARLFARDRNVVVVAMGRGGPPEPELVETPPSVEELVARSQAGRHAASDHLEIAALAGVPTIGCRRAGGGLAGGVAVSNVAEGARLAAELQPDLVLFDGSGAAIPPIATARRVLVTGDAERDPYLDTYRRLISDVVVERPRLRLRPTESLEGRVAVFTAGATDVSHLGADIVHVSANLSNRALLRNDLVDADTYLVEVKAAGIDVVAAHALARGIRVVLAGNDVAGIDDEALLALAPIGAR